MKRFFSSETLVLALVAIACTVTWTSTVEARWRPIRNLFQRQPVRAAAKAVLAPVRAFRCGGNAAAPACAKQLPEGAYTPLPASLLNEPPLPQVVIEPADLAPTLSPRS